MKVLIPTAGTGSRLGELSTHYNKTMLSVGEKPVISHIIDLYPKDAEFIVALGYKGNYIRQLLNIAYPTHKFNFVEVKKFKGPKSGLGHTLKLCRHLLNRPFFFHANDTIIDNSFRDQEFQENTLFLSKGKSNSKIYRTASVTQGKKIAKIYDKTDKLLEKVHDYTGTAYIKDYAKFNKYLDSIDIHIGESDFFMKNPDVPVNAFFVKYWYDIGNIEQLRIASKELGTFENLDKPTETIYFIDNNVIKFSTDTQYIKNRVARSKYLLNNVPKITSSSRNFFSYNYIPGNLVSSSISQTTDLVSFLDWAQMTIWKKVSLSARKQAELENICFNFYFDKTLDRLNLFYERYSFSEKDEIVNDIRIPSLEVLMEDIDWSKIKQGVPVLFHGDLHFENIIKKDSTFVLLDWRQSFGSLIEYGDIYYDLAKLNHGLIISHKIIKDGLFQVEYNKEGARFDFHRKNTSIECQKILKEFCLTKGYSWEKVSILTSLIFLNIAGLHHHPYSHLLYYLGKLMLWRELQQSQEGITQQ